MSSLLLRVNYNVVSLLSITSSSALVLFDHLRANSLCKMKNLYSACSSQPILLSTRQLPLITSSPDSPGFVVLHHHPCVCGSEVHVLPCLIYPSGTDWPSPLYYKGLLQRHSTPSRLRTGEPQRTSTSRLRNLLFHLHVQSRSDTLLSDMAFVFCRYNPMAVWASTVIFWSLLLSWPTPALAIPDIAISSSKFIIQDGKQTQFFIKGTTILKNSPQIQRLINYYRCDLRS